MGSCVHLKIVIEIGAGDRQPTSCFEKFDCERNTALELPLPQTHLVFRGGIPQRVSNCERSNMTLNTALELPLPQTHLVFRGGIPQRVTNWKRSNMKRNSALELLLLWTYFVTRGSWLSYDSGEHVSDHAFRPRLPTTPSGHAFRPRLPAAFSDVPFGSRKLARFFGSAPMEKLWTLKWVLSAVRPNKFQDAHQLQ